MDKSMKIGINYPIDQDPKTLNYTYFQRDMTSRKNNEIDRTLDLTHFIRSMQRIEGNYDCFARTDGNCDRSECAWRKWCLEEAKKPRQQKGR
jgi:hypothetical protein